MRPTVRCSPRYARERRLYIPIQAVPKMVMNAFIAAEDKTFYEHGGLDFQAMVRAGLSTSRTRQRPPLRKAPRRLRSRSPRTSFSTNEIFIDRKIGEALLAMKMERTFTKDRDPRTLPEPDLSRARRPRRRRRVAALSQQVRGRADDRGGGVLAALPKAPNNYHPFRRRDDAIARRNYVLDRHG